MVCKNCDNEFYLSSEPDDIPRFCPFCGERKSKHNGDVNIIAKADEA
jgi:hypothetical protein